jgi:hypothetical protein
MVDENNEARGYQQPAEPAPDLRALDRLVGEWEVSGDYVEGTSTFEWMEGGYFLLQRYGRHPRLRLRAGRGHADHLGRGERLPRVLQGHLQRGRRHP